MRQFFIKPFSVLILIPLFGCGVDRSVSIQQEAALVTKAIYTEFQRELYLNRPKSESDVFSQIETLLNESPHLIERHSLCCSGLWISLDDSSWNAGITNKISEIAIVSRYLGNPNEEYLALTFSGLSYKTNSIVTNTLRWVDLKE